MPATGVCGSNRAPRSVRGKCVSMSPPLFTRSRLVIRSTLCVTFACIDIRRVSYTWGTQRVILDAMSIIERSSMEQDIIIVPGMDTPITRDHGRGDSTFIMIHGLDGHSAQDGNNHPGGL